MPEQTGGITERRKSKCHRPPGDLGQVIETESHNSLKVPVGQGDRVWVAMVTTALG